MAGFKVTAEVATKEYIVSKCIQHIPYRHLLRVRGYGAANSF